MTRQALTVLATSSVPEGIRGALNQWFLEVLPGVFVGSPNRRIREQLWSSLRDGLLLEEGGYAAMIEQAQTEQGFRLTTVGSHPYEVEDFAGLQLISRHHRRAPPALLEDLPSPEW